MTLPIRIPDPFEGMERLPAITLRDRWIAAAEASEAVSAGYRDGLGEYEMDALEEERADAEQALRDHLLTFHGLTSADLKRSIL